MAATPSQDFTQLKVKANEALGLLKRSSVKLMTNVELNREFVTNEDFSRMADEKRLLVLGCTGAGKSTLLNKLGGWRKVWVDGKDGEGELKWEESTRGPPIFLSESSTESVTKFTTYANLQYFGNEARPFVVVDTPGHDDPETANIVPVRAGTLGRESTAKEEHEHSQKARDMISKQAADLFVKLKNMGHLHTILVLHNDVNSNRLNPATFELLQKLDEMFAKVEDSVWDHVVIAYSKCDEDARGWRSNLEKKKQELTAQVKEKFPRCKAELPIFALSGVCLAKDAAAKPADDFEKLWARLESSKPLDTTQIVKFEGLTERIQMIVSESDMWQRVASARKSFTAVLFNFVLLLMLLFIRTVLLPFLDMRGVWDELVWLSLFVFAVGPVRFWDFCRLGWDDHLLPLLVKQNAITAEKARELKFIERVDEKKKND